MSSPLRLALAATLLLGSGLGCSATPPASSGASAPQECTDGNACTCDASCKTACPGGNCFLQCNAAQCDFACAGGHCDAYIMPGASSTLGCADGYCSLQAQGSGTNVVDCPAGHCGVLCRGSTSCVIKACTHDCVLRCQGVMDGGCVNSCADGGGCKTIRE